MPECVSFVGYAHLHSLRETKYGALYHVQGMVSTLLRISSFDGSRRFGRFSPTPPQVTPSEVADDVQIWEFGGHDIFPQKAGNFALQYSCAILHVRGDAPSCWNAQSGGIPYSSWQSGSYIFLTSLRYSAPLISTPSGTKCRAPFPLKLRPLQTIAPTPPCHLPSSRVIRLFGPPDFSKPFFT